MDHIKTKVLGTTAALALLAPAMAGAKTTTPGLTTFHGTVVTASSSAGTVKIKRPTGTTMTFRVTSATTFERLGGRLGALRAGRSIEITARKVNGRWTARKVEPAAAEHQGGDDHGGDSGGHGSDD
jgi:hypothetical protein